MEIHYNFLIVTHNRDQKNMEILQSFGHKLQKQNILQRFQVAHVKYPSNLSIPLSDYPYLHHMVKEFPSIFLFTQEGWKNLTMGKDLSLNDVRLYSGMLYSRYYPILKDGVKVLTLIPITEKIGRKEINLEDVFKWISEIKQIG